MTVVPERRPHSKLGFVPVEGEPVYMTEAEYFAREELAERRSEYRYGKAVLMSGATEDHVTIAGNVAFALKAQLRGKGCRVLQSDQCIRANGQLYYPDVVATCGERVFDGFSPTTLLTPTVLVEVLSDSTEATDRNEKRSNYQVVPSLRSYLLVSQYLPHVECYERSNTDEWVYRVYTGKAEVIELPALGCRLALADVYDELDMWDAEPDNATPLEASEP